MTHPTTTLITCDGDPAPIDVDMVPLITAIWSRGVHTCNGCCQGGPGGRGYIGFPDIGEADKFCRLAMSGGAAPNLVAGLPEGTPPHMVESLMGVESVARDGGYWTWRLRSVRFPLITRCSIHLLLPHAHLDRATRWVTAAPADALDGLPDRPDDVPVFELAGRPVTEAEVRAYERLMADDEYQRLMAGLDDDDDDEYERLMVNRRDP